LVSFVIVGLPTEQSARIARNTQLILQEETGLCDVADPWGGSYMMESLTDELYNKSKEIINMIEEKGGMTSFVNSGHAKLMLEESAARKQGRIDSGEDVVVGVNKYRLSDEDEQSENIDVLKIDNSDVREKQIERIRENKACRDEDNVRDTLEKLEKSARSIENTSSGNNPNNLLHLCIECARAGSSLGEMSLALENAWGRHIPSTSMIQGAYAESFNSRNIQETTEDYNNTMKLVVDFEISEGTFKLFTKQR
jgi:methylmalonyl-CoA mutase